MKNLQTLLLKSLITFLFSLSTIYCSALPAKITQADSLFKARQYTQSAELYQSAIQEKSYSPAMLLKLAFIEEGLGKIGMTLYYLKLYYRASDDNQALIKMDELATKYNISGYSLKEVNLPGHWFEQHKTLIISILIALFLVTALLLFYTLRKNQKTTAPTWAMGIISVCLLVVNNYEVPQSIIIKRDNTYLMSGPSAASSVVAILPEGSQLQSIGQEDVWLKLKWTNQPVYVKKEAVLNTNL